MPANASASIRASNLCPLFVRIQPGNRVEKRVERGVALFRDVGVTACGGVRTASTRLGVVAQRLCRRSEYQLRIARGAVGVDPELPRGHVQPCESNTLRVPEGGRGVEPAGGERRDGLESDRHPVHLIRVGAAALEHRVEHRIVGGKPGDADRAALEVHRGPNRAAVAGDDRREWAADDRADPDDVDSALAREAEIVDVEDRELGPPGGKQLRCVGRA